jgi:CubicO group peptidase (beta-lactamase class C family)
VSYVPTFRQLLNHTSGLSGHGEWGGMFHPYLENIVLNGIDVNEPGKRHEYCGLGFELAAKAMEIKTGKCAAKIYEEHLFAPLGLQDIIMGNASSDGEFTAKELAVIAPGLADAMLGGPRISFVRFRSIAGRRRHSMAKSMQNRFFTKILNLAIA